MHKCSSLLFIFTDKFYVKFDLIFWGSAKQWALVCLCVGLILKRSTWKGSLNHPAPFRRHQEKWLRRFVTLGNVKFKLSSVSQRLKPRLLWCNNQDRYFYISWCILVVKLFYLYSVWTVALCAFHLYKWRNKVDTFRKLSPCILILLFPVQSVLLKKLKPHPMSKEKEKMLDWSYNQSNSTFSAADRKRVCAFCSNSPLI